MKEQTHSEIADIAAALDAAAFMSALMLAQRIELAVASAGSSHLSGQQMALVWAHWLTLHGDGLSLGHRRMLVKEILRLKPEMDEANALYAAAMAGADPLQPAAPPVFMIVSGEARRAKLRQFRRSLSERGALAWSVTGQAQIGLPQWHEEGCRRGHVSVRRQDTDLDPLRPRFGVPGRVRDRTGAIAQRPDSGHANRASNLEGVPHA
jgi:hypothetical protein